MINRARQLGWPAAATLIASLVGAATASLALALAPFHDEGDQSSFASGREIAEVKARLAGIEAAQQELRTDVREVRDLVHQLLRAEKK